MDLSLLSLCGSCIWLWDNAYIIRWSWIKTRRIKGKKQSTYTIKIHKHVPASLALIVHYSKEVLTKENECFVVYRGENCTNVFAEKLEKMLYNLGNFPKQKMIFTEEDGAKYWSKKTYHVCEDEYIHGDKNLSKPIHENSEGLHIHYVIYTTICAIYLW